LAYHRIYKYSSIGRPLDPAFATNRAVLILLPLAAILGGVTAWADGQTGLALVQHAIYTLLIVFSAWALARELDPDDHAAAFIGLAIAVVASLSFDSPGLLIVFSTMGLVRLVNRSTGLAARQFDSIAVMLLVLAVIYTTGSPLFGLVGALAFILDGSLKEPLRRQWIYALICFTGAIVYMVDHETGLAGLSAPNTLFEWLALLFLIIFALHTLLLKEVHSSGDVNGKKLDTGRVRGGMAVGLLAALQGVGRPEEVVVIVSAIAGIGIGMAFRKGFKAPAGG
jgi:hypothetical protein